MKHGSLAAADEEAEDEDSLTVSDEEIYYTNGGRIVYGGGGIVPDLDIDRETWKPIEINLERKSLFFDFAVKYISEHPDVDPSFETTDEVIVEFKKFIKEKDFTYKTSLQVALEELEETVKDETDEEKFAAAIENFKVMIENEKDTDFAKSLDYIKRAVKREIISSISGEKGVYEQIVLKNDKTVQKAVEILQKQDEYSKLMTEGRPESES